MPMSTPPPQVAGYKYKYDIHPPSGGPCTQLINSNSFLFPERKFMENEGQNEGN